MLLVHAQLQGLLRIFGQGKQVEIVVCASMLDAALEIYRGVNQGMICPAVFGVHVKGVRTHFYVGVMPENHCPFPPEAASIYMPRWIAMRKARRKDFLRTI